jgi:hypothetical protein
MQNGCQKTPNLNEFNTEIVNKLQIPQQKQINRRLKDFFGNSSK